MRAAKRLQTIHLKDKQGRVVSSWQRARVPVPDGISVSLPSPYRGLKPPHEEGRAQPVARIPGLDGSIGRRRIGSGSAGVATLIPRWMT